MSKGTYDPVNPKHYVSHPSGIQCIEVTEHMNFNCGNAVKYLWRAGLKGSKIGDLEKARWYIDREIRRLELEKCQPESQPMPTTRNTTPVQRQRSSGRRVIRPAVTKPKKET